MALDRNSKKRKQSDQEEPNDGFNKAVELEMLSDEEGESDVQSDDGEVDDFPEIDPGSDSDGDDEEDSELDEDEDDEQEEESEGDEDELHIFPKAKTVVSDITGKEKRVYPEIEPDYDSDSSTEDVSGLIYL